MRIVALSDTHQLHNKVIVPEGDILVHCGDFTNRGTDDAIKKFLTWFSSQPHEYKVFISGNHEIGLDKLPTKYEKLNIIKSFINSKFHYLENESIIIKGYKFYGSPITPWFHNWAWNVHRSVIHTFWNDIPDDTQVLLTHGPAYGILDLVNDNYDRDSHQGCESLLLKIKQLTELKLHIFGHLHLNGGKQVVVDNKIFANAAICDDYYNVVNDPIIIDL